MVPKTEVERMAHADLKSDERFLNALTFREQIGVTYENLRQVNWMVSYQRIGSKFLLIKLL